MNRSDRIQTPLRRMNRNASSILKRPATLCVSIVALLFAMPVLLGQVRTYTLGIGVNCPSGLPE